MIDKLYIDVRPLMENTFTGIPQLTWHLARYWLARSDIRPRFSLGPVEIEARVVQTIVDQRTGRYFGALKRASYPAMQPIAAADVKRSIGLYPHMRATREKLFGREIQIIHDLTAILTPEFHSADLVSWESRRFLRDIPQFDHFICVSEASRDDLVRYLGVDRGRTSVAYPGVAWSDDHFSVYNSMTQTGFEEYVLIFGTFEPRKNVELVFDYLVQNPEILDKFVFCFCGGEGWGGVYQRCLNNPRIAGFIESQRVRIIPFVHERLKYALMKEASFLIYPSFMEGFGSPVAEALSLGVPVVVSIGGSLPEVAGDAGYYFDPCSLDSLAAAIGRVTVDLTQRNAETKCAAYKQGARFSWSVFNDRVNDVVKSLAGGMGLN